MKDKPAEYFESTRPALPAGRAMNLCLNMLLDDQERSSSETVIGDITYDDLIGILLLGRDAAQRLTVLEVHCQALERILVEPELTLLHSGRDASTEDASALSTLREFRSDSASSMPVLLPPDKSAPSLARAS